MGRESGARRAKPRLVRICIGALCMCVYVCVGAHARARAYACGDLHAQVQYTAPSPAEFKAIVARIKADWGPLAVGRTLAKRTLPDCSLRSALPRGPQSPASPRLL